MYLVCTGEELAFPGQGDLEELWASWWGSQRDSWMEVSSSGERPDLEK